MNNTYSKDYIDYKSADIHFIYSFVLDFQNVSYECLVDELCKNRWEKDSPPDRQGKTPFLNIKRQSCDDKGKSTKYIPGDIHKKLGRDRRIDLIYKENFGLTSDSVYDKLPVKVQRYIRLFANGSGCITYKVSCLNKISLRRLHYILSLSQRQFERNKGWSTFSRGEGTERLYDMFTHDLLEVERLINSQIKKHQARVKIQDRDVLDLKSPKLVSQNPYVLSVLEVKSTEGILFWHINSEESDSLIKLKHRELASILLRMVYPDHFFKKLKETHKSTRIPYELRNPHGGLKNYSWDYRILLCFSRVSSLFASEDNSIEPANFLMNSLLDTLEILRTRWHMSIILNALLDQDMESIRDKPDRQNLAALQRIIKRRKQFAYFLNDPLPYNFEGGSVTKIIDVAEEEMWLSRLREMTFNKFAVLDKLYEDQMTLIRLTEFSKIEEELSSIED